MSCREDVLTSVGSGDRSTYDHNNIAKIIMPIMHSTAGHGDWFTPTMWHACCTCVGLHSYDIQTTLEFACKLTETTSSRMSQ